ncbi:hypothetical protein I4U23_023016 [Adineta vaga]|nr:hypothetical protein I4U23_023016 [Adineta vaga]
MTNDDLTQFRSADPFANTTAEDASNIGNGGAIGQRSSNTVHIRIQQQNRTKNVTTIQGIDEQFDKRLLLRDFKKNFACNGTIAKVKEYGEVIQLQGDKRLDVSQFLTDVKMYSADQIKVHGF